MTVSFITPLICSFATIVMAFFTYGYVRDWMQDRSDSKGTRMLIFALAVLIVFIIGTVLAYLMSFGVL